GAGLHRACPGNTDLAQCLYRPVAGLGPRRRVTREHGARRPLRVEAVGLALAPPPVSVGLVHLDHVQPPAAQMPAQSRTPGARALDPEREDFTEVGDPAGELAVAT